MAQKFIGIRTAHNQSQIPYNTIYEAARQGRIEGASQLGDERNSTWIVPVDSFWQWANNDYRPIQRSGRNEAAVHA